MRRRGGDRDRNKQRVLLYRAKILRVVKFAYFVIFTQSQKFHCKKQHLMHYINGGWQFVEWFIGGGIE